MIRTGTVEPGRPGEKQACERCGIVRVVRGGRAVSTLCRDCSSVLSTEQRAAWIDDAPEPLSAEMRADLHMQSILANPDRLARALGEAVDVGQYQVGKRLYDARTDQLTTYLRNQNNARSYS